MEASAGGDKLHIVVFPWLAFGHMLPFLELSKSLAKRGHLISFVSTQKNIQRFPNLPPQISPLINFIPLPLPKVEGKPDDAEATTDLPPENIQYLKKALDGLERPFRSFLREASPKPDWIIQDLLQHWIPKIAAELHVPLMYFCTIPAAALTFIGHPSEFSSRGGGLEGWLVSPPWVPFPSRVAYRLHEMVAMARDAELPLRSGVTDARRIEAVVTGGCAMAIRTCRELEAEWLPILEKIHEKPVIPVGLLPPTTTDQTGLADTDTVDWLGTRSRESVVYVALGSEVAIGVELLHELALGLELAGFPFLWALRRPYGLPSGVEILPEGFEERTRGYGKVVMGWVPQMKVLGDKSVGGFLTHCGWSSVVESLHFGHPLVLLPVFGDQGLNARLLEEKGIGVEVERMGDGSFTRSEVAKALNLIMVDEDGGSYRKKAKEMKKIFADKECQEKYVDEFVQFLLSNGTTKG